jgi:Na+/serine symporter
MQLLKSAYLKPMTLGVGVTGLAFLMRPLATSWFGLGLASGIVGLAYVTAGFAVGVFGETEKRALVELYRVAVRSFRRHEDMT